MKKFTTVVVALILFVATSIAQVLSPIVTKSKNLDYAKLAQIDTLLNNYVNNNWLVGASTIIVKDNQVVYYKGHGF
jgi:hypothetical protein